MLEPMRRALRTALAAAVGLLLCAPAALAADGDLDTDFDYDGVAEVGDLWTAEIALQPDGKIVVGAHVPGGDNAVVVWRLTDTGALDRSFGDDGRVALLPPGGMRLGGVAVAPDGKIVVAGTQKPDQDGDAVVYRLTSAGALDTGFGGDGSASFDYGPAYSSVDELAVQPDGRVVLAGLASGADIGVARLRTDGTLDPEFAGDGRTVEDAGGDRDSVEALVLQGARVVVAGRTNAQRNTDPASDRFLALALTAGGARDASFGDGGVVAPDLGAPATASAALVAPDGGLLLVGSAAGRATALKLDAGGRPDAGFSGDGVASIDGFATRSVTTTIDGKFALGGVVGDALAVAKLTPAGTLDPSFGDGGVRVHQSVRSWAGGDDLLRQADGGLLVGGRSKGETAVARLTDSLPTLDIHGGRAFEGEAVPFAAALNKTSGFPVSASFVTGTGSAERSDFTGRRGTVSIPPGAIAGAIPIQTTLDRLFEPDEDFRVEIGDVVNARLGNEIGRATIVNTLRAGRCANVIIGARGIDLLTGSEAGDLMRGRDDHDLLLGLGGDDCLYGNAGNDEMDGGAGDDKVDGGRGDDRLKGRGGNDRIIGDAGRNRYSGGSGNDRIYSRNGRAEKVDCGSGRDYVKADRRDRLRRCERVSRPH
jgi:uncharacterized delta-60 repeat protein